MNTVYLNGDYMPMDEARISPMDRGFLFGDGIYEVVPSYDGKLVGFGPHMDRMQDGLDAIEIKLHVEHTQWRGIADELIERNGGGNLGIYFHVSRGADTQRNHAYPEGIAPTIYAFAFEIPPAPMPDKSAATCYTVSTAEDLRWKRCNIKSTALLGNVMHYQDSYAQGHSETILYNPDRELCAHGAQVVASSDAWVLDNAAAWIDVPGICLAGDLVPMASAVIERRGGMLIHGAIIAREYGLPCVTGIPGAAEIIETGDELTVDGYLGIVTVAGA